MSMVIVRSTAAIVNHVFGLNLFRKKGHALSFCLLQLLFTVVCLPGWIFRPLPYILGTVQNGAHFVWSPFFTSLCFLLGCLCLAILLLRFLLFGSRLRLRLGGGL